MRKTDAKVSVAEILNYMKFEGTYQPVADGVRQRKSAAEAAREAGFRVRSLELQKAADMYRLQRGLFRASDTEMWLDANGLTREDLEDYLETELLARKFIRAQDKKTKSQKKSAT